MPRGAAPQGRCVSLPAMVCLAVFLRVAVEKKTEQNGRGGQTPPRPRMLYSEASVSDFSSASFSSFLLDAGRRLLRLAFTFSLRLLIWRFHC